MRGMPPTTVTELVKLTMNVDEGHRGDVVAVPEARASQLFRARAATPVTERAPEVLPRSTTGVKGHERVGDMIVDEPPGDPVDDDFVFDIAEQATGTPGGEDGDDGPSDDQPDVPQGDGTPAEHARMAARSRASREGRDRREGTS